MNIFDYAAEDHAPLEQQFCLPGVDIPL